MDQLRLDGGADPYPGAQLGPANDGARDLIAQLRAHDVGWAEVARTLNARQVPTPSGRGQWWPASAYRHTQARTGWAAYMRSYRAGHARRP